MGPESVFLVEGRRSPLRTFLGGRGGWDGGECGDIVLPCLRYWRFQGRPYFQETETLSSVDTYMDPCHNVDPDLIGFKQGGTSYAW